MTTQTRAIANLYTIVRADWHRDEVTLDTPDGAQTLTLGALAEAARQGGEWG